MMGISSRCGILCGECELSQNMGCSGCVNILKPFWGENCPIKTCCESKAHNHCGQCAQFPCENLTAFAYDKDQGDDGKRIEQCKEWSKKLA